MEDDIALLPAHILRQKVKSKEISAVELTQHFLNRIEKYNEDFYAYDWVLPEQALNDAKRVDRWVSEGNSDLQLLGVPVIVDGAMRIEGIPLSFGCIVDVDEIPKMDAITVKVLRSAGAIILGKGNVSEFGLTATTINSLSPEAKNPFNPLYSGGGPCGGLAVAVAKGLAAVGVGPDKNGGMRFPASFCGLIAMKPTRGLVSFPREFSISMINKAITQVCPMGRCVKDVAMVLNVLAQEDLGDHDRLRVGHENYEEISHEPLPKVRIGWIPQFAGLPIDPDLAELYGNCIDLLESTGFKVERVELDLNLDILKHYCNVFSCEHYVPIVALCELDKCGACKRLMPGTHRWLNYAKTVSGVSISSGINRFFELREKLNRLLDRYDFLITPASAMAPLSLEEVEEENRIDGCFKYSLKALSYLLLYNLSGHPSIVFPVGHNLNGIPVGINVISKYCSEDLLFQFANAMEETLMLHGKTSFQI